MSIYPKNASLELLAGGLAFLLFCAGLRWTPGDHAAIIFILGETAYFLVSIAPGTGRSQNLFLTTLLILIPGISVIILLAYSGYAFTSRFHVLCFVAAALLGTLSGRLLRQFFRSGKTGATLVAFAGLIVASVLIMRIAIPAGVAAIRSKSADLPGPAFTFFGVDGERVSSEQLRGRVVLLAFWATWCRPCMAELPHVQQIYQHYRDDKRVVIWAVDSGISNDTVEKQRRMISAQQWNLPFAQDSENLEYKMGFHGLPKLVLLDQQGRIRWVHDGFDGSEDLNRQVIIQIETLLRSR